MLETIKASLRRKYRRLVRRLYQRSFGGEHQQKGYAQFGEDQVLAEMLSDERRGFYVDVGAHHPYRFSNTGLLHLKGWRGINVDPSRAGIDAFESARPGDVNLCCAVGATNGTARMFAYDDPVINTLSQDRATGIALPCNEISVPMRTLNDILAEHLPDEQTIDLLSVDVEGLDLTILQSLDFNRYRPRLICMEINGLDFERLTDEPVYRLLVSQGYRMVSMCYVTGIFQLKSVAKSCGKASAA